MRRFFSQHKKLLSIIAGLCVYSTIIVYATPPTSPYDAGETLDPGCAPGDTHCTVSVGGSVVTDGTLSGAGTVDDPLSVVGSADTVPVLSVRAATTAALNGAPSYSNGSSGVGATLTEGSNGTISTIDGVTVGTSDRILVKNQASDTQNGIYLVTSTGSSSAPYVLTRTTDSDESDELDSQIASPSAGTTNKGKLFAQQTDTPAIGADSIVYSRTTALYVSQRNGGTQVNGQIPYWTSKSKQLSKGSSSLTFDGSTLATDALTLNTGTTSINGVSYTWPSIQGGSETFLMNDSTGSLSWGKPTSLENLVFNDPHNAYYGGSVGVASSFGTSSFLDFEKQDDTHAPLVNNQLQVGESLFELTDINTAHFFRYNFSTGNVSISALGGNGDQVVTVDDNGFLGTAAIGGGTPALPENQIAFGDNSDLLTSNSDLTFNGSVLTAPGLHVASTISVPAPTNAQAAQTCNAGCEYTANGNSFTYRVYSYKTFGSSRTYSDSYTSVNFNDDESSNSFDVTVSWTPAAGADGYRILVQNDAYNFDAGYDTTSTSFIDDACDSVCFDAAKSGTFPNSSGALFDGSIGVGGNIAIGQQLLQADSNDNFLIGRNNGSGTGYNFFVGVNTGNGATNVNGSNFLGLNAGINATNATESNFFGIQAGYHAANATESNFFGTGAGNFAASADHSNFLGSQAGYSASGASFSNFIGQSAGVFATNASHSNFIGAGGIGIRATNASYSNFFGWQTGTDASNASYSNLFGYHVGFNAINNGGSDNNIGSNNIIIGTNISLPDATADAINIGGILFGTGTYSDHTAAEPSFDPVAGGKIGIGVVTPSYTLQVGNSGVSGIVARFQNATGTCDINPTGIALSCSSDRTLKKNITAIDSASGDDGADAVSDATLQKILSLQPVTYNWNSEDDSAIAHAGFIAQDIRDVFPDLVSEDSTTHLLSLNYIGLIPYTIKALQEMDLKIAVLPVETDQTFTDRLTAFLKSIAENGVALIDGVQTKTIDTNTLCVADDTGAKTCITKEQLDALLEGNGHREHQHAHQKDDGATQGDGTSNGIDSHTGSDTTTTDTTSGAGDPTDPTTTDTPADTSSITDTAVVPVPESETPPAPDAAPAQ